MKKFGTDVPLLFPTIPQKVNIFGNLLESKMPSKIILPNAYGDLSRSQIIDKFLRNGWLPEKETEVAQKWLASMLDEFSLELLLHAKHGGLDKLLIGTKTEPTRRSRGGSTPLIIVPETPKKPKVAVVEIEEIEGDLDFQVKTIKVKDIPNESDEPYNDCD